MFQSAPRCRGRHEIVGTYVDAESFQSAPPCRGRLAFPPPRGSPRRCFNPRPGVGGDMKSWEPTWTRNRFNPRPRVGGDDECRPPLAPQASFNPRPRVGGDMTRCRTRPGSWRFQSAPPCRGRQGMMFFFKSTDLFQSAPPCRGRPRRPVRGQPRYAVSIRAPV